MRAQPPWDVVVAGGGPVGLASALHAAQLGLRVAVVEPRAAPVDKACGEGLMPTALRELARLDVAPPGRDFVGIRYETADGGLRVAARFAGQPGRGVRRTALHEALSRRAAQLGVVVVADRVVDVGWDDVRAAVVTSGGRRVTGRYVVGADGLHSVVRRRSGLDRADQSGPRRFGLRQHYAVEPWDDHVEVHWSADTEAYVTPVGPRCVGVALLTARRVPFDVLLEDFPELCRRLGRAPVEGRVQGAGPLRQRAGSPRRGRVLLVGDAAGYVDALTGEGLAVGLVSARLAVAAISTGDVDGYPGQWRRMSLRPRLLTEATLVAATTPWLRRRIVSEAARLPALFTGAVRALA